MTEADDELGLAPAPAPSRAAPPEPAAVFIEPPGIWQRTLRALRHTMRTAHYRLIFALGLALFVLLSVAVHRRSAGVHLEVRATRVSFRTATKTWLSFGARIEDVVLSGLTRVLQGGKTLPAERLYTDDSAQPTSIHEIGVPAGTTLSLRAYEEGTLALTVDAKSGVEVHLTSSTSMLSSDGKSVESIAPGRVVAFADALPLVIHMKLAGEEPRIFDSELPLRDPSFVVTQDRDDGTLVPQFESALRGGTFRVNGSDASDHEIRPGQQLRIAGTEGRLVSATLVKGELSLIVEAVTEQLRLVRSEDSEDFMPTWFDWLAQSLLVKTGVLTAGVLAFVGKIRKILAGGDGE